MQFRGKTLLVIFTVNSVGKLIGVGLAFKFLADGSNEWSSYMLFSTLPCFLALILSWIFVDESYRYLLSVKKMEEAFRVMERMIEVNKMMEGLLASEKNQI